MRYDKEFRRDVLELASEAGLDLGDLKPKLLDTLLAAIQDDRLNDHESALALAYQTIGHVVRDDWERARVLLVRTRMLQEEWDGEGLIQVARLVDLAEQAEQILQQENT